MHINVLKEAWNKVLTCGVVFNSKKNWENQNLQKKIVDK